MMDKMKCFRFVFFVFLALLLFTPMIVSVVEAADNVIYIDAALSDRYPSSATPDCSTYSPTNGSCGGGTEKAYKSLRDVNAVLNPTKGDASITILFKRGHTWNFTSDSDAICIRRSNVTLAAFGTGDNPILDGNGQYPSQTTSSGKPVGYAVKVGDSSSLFSNVYIKNITIKNMYGGGVLFSGKSANNFRGPGSVQNCEFFNIGIQAINLFEVPNSSGPSGAIKIENNHLDNINVYYKKINETGNWPQAINTNNSTYGHECRYNIVNNIWGEGIGGNGFDVVEYNIISDTRAPSIYLGTANRSGSEYSTIARYNLIWRSTSTSYNACEIRVNDEKEEGDNTDITYEIYGNIVVGGSKGISLRNNPGNGPGRSPWGRILVYNNTLIDNQSNMVTADTSNFKEVYIKNNVFIISGDAEGSSRHIESWNVGSMDNWDISNNFFYGKGATKDSDLPAAFRGSNAFGTKHPLPKTSGWRRMADQPIFANMYPQADSELMQRIEAVPLSGFSKYLTIGTDWSGMPGTPKFVMKDQNDNGNKWSFGALIFNDRANIRPAPPINVLVSTR
ncbi:hypothetical protein KQH27_00450 [bacterium]|nr:hypothetical protein [bacterium]